MAKGPSHIRHSRPFVTGVKIHTPIAPSYSVPCTARTCSKVAMRGTSAVGPDTSAEIDVYSGAMIVCFVLSLRVVALGRLGSVEELDLGAGSVEQQEGETREKEEQPTRWRWDAVRKRAEG